MRRRAHKRPVIRPTHKPLMAFAAAFLLACVSFTYVLTAMSPAYAQAIAPVHASVDLTSLATNAANLLYVVLSGAAGFLSWFGVNFIASKTKMNDAQFEAVLQQRVDDVMQKAIDGAHTWMLEQIAAKSSQIRTVRFDNFFLGKAVEIFENAVPDIVTYFKLTPERIEDMIRARLAPYIGWVEPDSGVVPLKSPTAAPVVDVVPVVAVSASPAA